MEMLEHARFPTIPKILLCVKVLRKKAAFMRHADEIEDRRNHIQVRDQNRLGQVAGKLLIAAGNSLPETRNCFAEGLGIDLLQMGADLETFINLVSFQFPDRNPADQMGKRILAEAKVNV